MLVVWKIMEGPKWKKLVKIEEWIKNDLRILNIHIGDGMRLEHVVWHCIGAKTIQPYPNMGRKNNGDVSNGICYSFNRKYIRGVQYITFLGLVSAAIQK